MVRRLLYLGSLFCLGIFLYLYSFSSSSKQDQPTAAIDTISQSQLPAAPPPPPPPIPQHLREDMGDFLEKSTAKLYTLKGCENLENKPCYNCNIQQMKRILYANLSYPAEARKKQLSGIVTLFYMVDKTGFIRDEKIVQDIGGGCGDAVLEVIQKLRRTEFWHNTGPARNIPHKIFYQLNIEFGPKMPKD